MPLPLPSNNPKPFMGRIISEEAFLVDNLGSHSAFDVFRLDDLTHLDQRRLLQEAKRISANRSYGENWFLISNVCSSAAAEVLAKATGQNIKLVSPDAFTQPPFHKLPELANRSIDIRGALQQARTMNAAEAQAGQFEQLVPQVAAAQTQARQQGVRRLLTAEEFTRLTEVRRQQLLDAYWDYLRTLVGYACSDPGDLRTLNESGRVPGVTLSLETLTGYVSANRGRMSRCESEIFDNLLAANGAAPVASLTSWGQTYPRHARPARPRRKAARCD